MLILFYKPYGVLSQFTPDKPCQRTLAEFNFPTGVYPIGRLDLDSEGLILLSDEGALNRQLLHPKAGHERSYWVQVEGEPTPEALAQLRRGGILIQGYRTRPCKADLIPDPQLPPRDPPVRFRKAIPTSWLEMKLIEGKNRQVRRMTAAVGFPTLRLFRAAIGALQWNHEEAGSWRELTPAERKLVFQ